MTATAATPPWMRHVLLAAGAYNILWGALAVVFPHVMFDWLGMARPNYPQFWQCIGMIVGVYGLGYGIAAFDPVRHWPIVLWTGALPWVLAINCVFNDLISWVPFALILWHAWKTNRKR